MRHSVLLVYADASVYPRATGLGAVIKDERGNLIAWRNRLARAMTCNEAEYAALIFALEQARTFAPREVRVFSDSRLVIEQMRGWIRVHSEVLRPLHRRARELAEGFEQITFTHIPREDNQLADAIADDAVNESRTAPGTASVHKRMGQGTEDREGDKGTGGRRQVAEGGRQGEREMGRRGEERASGK